VISTLILVGCLLVVVGWVWLGFVDEYNYLPRYPLCVGVGMLALGGVLCLPAAINRIGVGGELVQIAALRSAASRVDLASSEDIFGKVADVNQLIASNQWYRRQWWASEFVAAEWDTVTPIPIPNHK
jgi:hypothetical protein